MQTKGVTIIILSGGTSSRFGSDKSQVLIAGESLIARILKSIPTEFEIIIVGPDPKIGGSQYSCIQEKPLGGGPVAGFKAALSSCSSEVVVLIAIDMPFALPRVIYLLNTMRADADALMYVDSNGFKQSLAALYRVEAVELAFAKMGDVTGKSMQELISHLRVQEIPIVHDLDDVFMDIDTHADLDRAIAFAVKLKDNSTI